MTNQKITTDLSIVNRLVIVVPRFSTWQGQRAMHEGDYSVGVNGKLPPKEVAKSYGAKAIIDPKELRVFDRIKHRAEALLDSCGVRFLSGWAIPQERTDEVLRELDSMVVDYETAKADFLQRYDSLVHDWAQKNPTFEREILEGKLDENSVAERIRAGYESFRLLPVNAEKAKTLVESIGGLAGELISSVSKSAKVFFKESFLGKTRANRKTVNAVIRIRERLQGLAFLSSRIVPLIALMDETLAQMPDGGYFSGEPFWRLATLVKTLSDETLLAEICRDEVAVQSDHQELTVESEDDSIVDVSHEQMGMPQSQDESVETELDANSVGVPKSTPKEPDLFSELDEYLHAPKRREETVLTQRREKTVVKDVNDETVVAEVQEVQLPEVDIGQGLYF